MEDDDPALLGLRFLGIHHGSAHDEVGVGILPQLAGDQAEGVLILQELVSMEHWDKKKREREEQLGSQSPGGESLRHILEIPCPIPHHLVPSKIAIP